MPLHVSSTVVLIIRRSKLYYTASAITEMSVYCAVRTGSLYIIQVMCFVWI